MPKKHPNTGKRELEFLGQLANPAERRTFLKWSGITLGVAVVACADDPTAPNGLSVGQPGGAQSLDHPSLGEGNIAVLNYAYALEQLEAAFYTQAIGTSAYMGLTAEGQQIFDDLRAHEVVHRDYLAAAIPALGGVALPELEFTFPDEAFADTATLLETSKTFEDLGVSAYNGAGQLFSNDDLGKTLLGVAGKIVSVEARHAAAIRDLIMPKSASFAGDDVINSQGLDLIRVPSQVLPLANPFVNGDITDPNVLDASGLPAPGYMPDSPTATV